MNELKMKIENLISHKKEMKEWRNQNLGKKNFYERIFTSIVKDIIQ